MEKLKAARQKLAEMTSKYGSDHPKVKEQKTLVRLLMKDAESLKDRVKAADQQDESVSKPVNVTGAY